MELVAGCYEQVLLGFATRPGQVTGIGGNGGSKEALNGLGWKGAQRPFLPTPCHGQSHLP